MEGLTVVKRNKRQKETWDIRFATYQQEERDEEMAEFVADESVPQDLRDSFAKFHLQQKVVDLLTAPEEQNARDLAIDQVVKQGLYREVVARIAELPNLARSLSKHGKTPKIRLIHRDHNFGLDLTFRLPRDNDGEDPPALLWFMTPTKGEFVSEETRQTTEGTYLMTTSFSTFVSLHEYHDQRAKGLEPRAALAATYEARDKHPRYGYAPLVTQARCSCGDKRNLDWYTIVHTIEKSLDPTRPRIDNGMYIARLRL